MHYYKRNLGDYAKKCGRLSMLQHGSYTLLIDSCYDREQFPTIEEAIEWTWASSKEEIEAVEFVLKRFFVLEGCVYVQKRIQEEIAEFHSKSEVNKRIAIERETKRKEKGTVRARSVDDLPKSGDEPPPNQEPRTNNQDIKDTGPDESVPSSKRSAVALKTYLDACKAAGNKPIPPDHPVRRYCAQAGIDESMVHLAWRRFREEHLAGTRKSKRYADWPAAFSNCVKDSWYGLWYVNADGPANWSPKGVAARKVADAEIAERQQQGHPND